MATSSKIRLSASQKPAFSLPGITSDSADTTSELLQENHEQHHIFFNHSGFHNHIVHHLLTLFALRASPSQIKRGYEDNKSYQRPPVAFEKSIVDDMHDSQRFQVYLGNEKYYHDYLAFFKNEIDQKGWQNVVNEYIFKSDERADDMLVRLFAGFLHPIIHLGFGVEFEQPAIIAEGLAQAAVHDRWMAPLFFHAENAAKEGDKKPSKSLVQLLDEMHADQVIRNAAHFEDSNKIRDGLFERAPDDVIRYASQYTVDEENLEERTAEMINAAVYFTAAAQHPPNIVKFDFFYMHSVNCSIFFSSFLKQPWLALASKIRLLEWKGRNDLIMYASRHSPDLFLSEITGYQSKKSSDWDEIFERVNDFADDGHASKLIRALAHGADCSQKFEDSDAFRIKKDMWLKVANMAMDSVEAEGPTWVRSTGFDEAWKTVPERVRAQL